MIRRGAAVTRTRAGARPRARSSKQLHERPAIVRADHETALGVHESGECVRFSAAESLCSRDPPLNHRVATDRFAHRIQSWRQRRTRLQTVHKKDYRVRICARSAGVAGRAPAHYALFARHTSRDPTARSCATRRGRRRYSTAETRTARGGAGPRDAADATGGVDPDVAGEAQAGERSARKGQRQGRSRWRRRSIPEPKRRHNLAAHLAGSALFGAVDRRRTSGRSSPSSSASSSHGSARRGAHRSRPTMAAEAVLDARAIWRARSITPSRRKPAVEKLPRPPGAAEGRERWYGRARPRGERRALRRRRPRRRASPPPDTLCADRVRPCGQGESSSS